MSTESQQTKEPSQEEERFWNDFDRQYFSSPHPSLVLCLKNHIWHTRHISSKITKYLSSKGTVKKNLKKNNTIHLRSVKFPLRLSSTDKTLFNPIVNPTTDGIFRYFSSSTSLSSEQFQGLLENDNVYKPLVSPKHDSNQRLPTIYSSPLPDAIHLTLYVPKVSPKTDSDKKEKEKDKPKLPDKSKDEHKEKKEKEDTQKLDEVEAINNFVDSFKSLQLLKNQEVPQIISGPNPSWFVKGKGRFKKGVDLGPKYKKCDKLVKNPHGLLSDPVWQHFNTNYVNVPVKGNDNMFSYDDNTRNQNKVGNKTKTNEHEDIKDGTDLLNYHNMCDMNTCRVDYSPLLFTFVSSKRSLLCKRCLGFPKLFCNLCKNLKGSSTAIFSSQYISDEKYHMTYNLLDLFKLRSNTDDCIQTFYVNPYKGMYNNQPNFSLLNNDDLQSKEEDDDTSLIYNYIQTLESLNAVFNNLLNRIANEYKPDTSRWHDIESKMLETYIEQYNNKTLDNRYTYSVQRQSLDVLLLRLKVNKSSDLPSTWTDRALCSICGTDEDWDDDPILFCDCCYIPMHFCCLGYKPGTLTDIKQKLNVNKFHRLNFYNHLANNIERPVKKIKLDKLDDYMDMDEDEWYCPVCTYLMEQLVFLDENLVMTAIRNIAGPKTQQHLEMINENYTSHKVDNATSKNKDNKTGNIKPSDQSKQNKDNKVSENASVKAKDDIFKRKLPIILGFDYDNPSERSFITVHPSNQNNISSLEKLKGDKESLNESSNEKKLEKLSILNLYNGKKESVMFNQNNVSDPKIFCKNLLSKKGLYFENNFWLLLSRANLTGIQEYLNYHTYEELYLSRLVQQDKLIQSTKYSPKKRSNSITSKSSSSRSLSLNSMKDSVPVKEDEPPTKSKKKEPETQLKKEKDQSIDEEPSLKKQELKSAQNINCKNPLKKMYLSLDLKLLSQSTNFTLNKNGHETVQKNKNGTETHTKNKNSMKKEHEKKENGKKDLGEVYLVIKVPVCIFCGFDAFIPGGGPMKRTSNSGTWGHIKCALANECTIEPDEINYGTFLPKIKALKCIFCNIWSTSVIQCSYGNCCKAFHVPCSSSSPNCLFTWDTNGKPDVLCPIHSKGLAPTSLLRKLQIRLSLNKDKDGKERSDYDKTSHPYSLTEKNKEKKEKSKHEKQTEKMDKRRADREKYKMEGQNDKVYKPKLEEKTKERDSGNKKGSRDAIDNICVNENLYLNHFLRPNYSNLTKLLELLLNEKVGTIFQSNMSSNYYKTEVMPRYASIVSNVTSDRSTTRSVSNKFYNMDDLSSNEDDMSLLKEFDREDDECVPNLVTPMSVHTSSNTDSTFSLNSDKLSRQNSTSSQNTSDSAAVDTSSNMEISSRVNSIKSEESDHSGTDKSNTFDYQMPDEELETDDDLVLSRKSTLIENQETTEQNHTEGKCPLNNINKNNCFWCCLGFDLKNHNRHVFDDKTPSSKMILSILYNNNHSNVNTIKSIINSKYESAEKNETNTSKPQTKLKNDENGEKKSARTKTKEDNREEFKIPWSILSNIIIDNVVDDKINTFINGDLVNNNKLVKKNDFLVQKMASEALVRLFNTFEPDSSMFVVKTLFSILKHVDFIHEIDDLYGYNNLYFCNPSPSIDNYMSSDKLLDKRLDLIKPRINNAIPKLNSISPLSDQSRQINGESNANQNYSARSDSVQLNGMNKNHKKTQMQSQPQIQVQDQNLLSFIQTTNSSKPLNLPESLSKMAPLIKDIFNKDKTERLNNPITQLNRVVPSTNTITTTNTMDKNKTSDSVNIFNSLNNNASAVNGNDQKDRDAKKALKERIFNMLKQVNQVEIIKMDKSLLPNSILRKYINNKKITICKVCLEFKYIENDIDNNKRKRNIYNESYRKCINCNVEVCNSCLSVNKTDFEHLTNSSTMIIGDYIGQDVDDFYFSCIRCKEFSENLQMPLLNCVLCSRYDGLMLKINSKLLSFVPSRTSFWNNYSYVHLVCLEWLYWSKNAHNHSKKLNKTIFEQNCNYCGIQTGATVTCSNTTCISKFHPSCAAFLGCKIDVGKKNESLIGVKRALCLRHTLISICRTSLSERKFMVAPSYLYEVLVNNNYFTSFFRGVYLSPNCINNRTKLTTRFKIKKKSRSLDYKNNLSIMKMASYINYGLIINKTPQMYDLTISEAIARDRLIQGMNYIFYQQKSPNHINFYNQSYKESKENSIKDIKNIITLIKNGLLKPIQGSKRGRKPKSLDGSDVDKRRKMSMEEILRYAHSGILDNGDYYCPVCFSIYFENSPGLPGDELHWIGCDKCERWFHFVCAGVWVDFRDKDSWYCYHCSNA
uniref:PHD-zinc-finger like domain/PHD-like zinc-binding domain containing protein, putative n=1 Tax=Theileria annulata TaxID=5874 RepID=A0A3B0N254_THEAN